MPKRIGNNPKRRLIPENHIAREKLIRIAEMAQYEGSAHHKTRPGDYGFSPSTNPRPHKSLCDGKRTVLKNEATKLLGDGISRGMISSCVGNGLPKYIWAVDSAGEVYEAKLGGDGLSYHGYCLGHDDTMRKSIIKEWRLREA